MSDVGTRTERPQVPDGGHGGRERLPEVGGGATGEPPAQAVAPANQGLLSTRLLSRLTTIARRELDDRTLDPGDAQDILDLVVMAQHAAASVAAAFRQALAQVAANHENLRRESERTEKAFRERDDARAALADARDALERIVNDADQAVRESKGEWASYYAGKRDVAREVLVRLDAVERATESGLGSGRGQEET